MNQQFKYKSQTIKLLKQEYLLWLWIWQWILKLTPKSWATKEKPDKLNFIKIKNQGSSLVVHWLRMHLAMQRMKVWSLIWELRPMCCRATKPTHHSYWAHALLEHRHRNYWAYVLQLLKSVHLGPVLHKRRHCNEKPVHRQRRAAPACHN